jgi:hypothetical protein
MDAGNGRDERDTECVFDFVLGLQNPRVVLALAAHGMSAEDMEHGWDRLNALTSARLEETEIDPDPELVARLEAWHARWARIAHVALSRRFARVHRWLFGQIDHDADPLTAAVQFLEGLQAMEEEHGREGVAAMKQLLGRAGGQPPMREALLLLREIWQLDKPHPTREELERRAAPALSSLWAWYDRWIAVARVAITDPELRRAIGLERDHPPGSNDSANA